VDGNQQKEQIDAKKRNEKSRRTIIYWAERKHVETLSVYQARRSQELGKSKAKDKETKKKKKG